MAIAAWVNSAVVVSVFLLPLQQSYIHPDEFFQSPEVVAGDLFGITAHRPWEFEPSFPCRTIVWPSLISGFPYAIARWLELLGLHYLDSYALLWGPRLACAFLMAHVLKWMTEMTRMLIGGRGHISRLKYAAVMPFLLVFGTRPFSNSIEIVLFARLLLDTMPIKDVKRSQRYRHNRAWRVGVLVVSGFFNRPTFLTFAGYPVLVWLCHLWKTERPMHTSRWSTLKTLSSTVRTAMGSATWMLVVFVLLDTFYFTTKQMDCPLLYVGLKTRSISSWISALQTCSLPERFTVVLTPLNWLKYNMQTEKLAEHGLHPRVTHSLLNMPLLFGILAPVAYLAVGHLAWRRNPLLTAVRFVKLPMVETLQAQRGSNSAIVMGTGSKQDQAHAVWCFALLLGSIFPPLLVLSSAPHQEARFLLPLGVPLLVLFGHYLYRPGLCKTLSILHISAMFLFFGVCHQGGLTKCLVHMENHLYPFVRPSPLVHRLLFFRTYTPPWHLLMWPVEHGDQLQVHAFGGAPHSELHRSLTDLHGEWSRTNGAQLVFLAAPASISFRNLTNAMLLDHGRCTWLNVVGRFGPHFSSEAPPHWLQTSDCLPNDKACESAASHKGIRALIAFWKYSLQLNLYKVSFENLASCNQTAEVKVPQSPIQSSL